MGCSVMGMGMGRAGKSHFDITCPSIQVHVQVLDLPEIAKEFLQILLTGFFVDVGDENDPAFDGADGDGTSGGARVGGCGCDRAGGGAVGGVRWGIDIHFCGGHGGVRVSGNESGS